MLSGVNSVAMAASGGPSLAGQAHDGIDSIPNSGTWNLEKGERVVDARMNKDLSRYLNNQTTNNHNQRGGDTFQINAPVTVQASANQSPEEARRQGQAVSRELRMTILSVIRDEKRSGGELARGRN